MSPSAHRLAVLALYGVAAVGTFVVLSLIGVVVDGPARAFARYAASFGLPGSLAALALIVGGTAFFALWAVRRDQRHRITATSVIDVPQSIAWRDRRRRLLWACTPLIAGVILAAIIGFTTS